VSIIQVNDEMRWQGKWLRCHGGEHYWVRVCYVKLEVTHTIGALKCSDDVVYIASHRVGPGAAKVDGDGKDWPDTEILPDRSFGSTENFEIETVWGLKYDLSPSSTNMH
jgi:hypothetical protein